MLSNSDYDYDQDGKIRRHPPSPRLRIPESPRLSNSPTLIVSLNPFDGSAGSPQAGLMAGRDLISIFSFSDFRLRLRSRREVFIGLLSFDRDS